MTNSEYAPTKPEGATFHACEQCGGSGSVVVAGEEIECSQCDGTGEWFE